MRPRERVFLLAAVILGVVLAILVDYARLRLWGAL